jgi:hypothetical protein
VVKSVHSGWVSYHKAVHGDNRRIPLCEKTHYDSSGWDYSEEDKMSFRIVSALFFHRTLNHMSLQVVWANLRHSSVRETFETIKIWRSISEPRRQYHEFLCNCSLSITTKFIVNGGEEEVQHMNPVIARVHPDQRILPGGRIVYEPNYSIASMHACGIGEHRPTVIELHLPNGATVHSWTLRGKQQTGPIEGHSNLTLVHNFKITSKSKSLSFPAKIFYKRHDGGTQTHAVSVPLSFIVAALFTTCL